MTLDYLLSNLWIYFENNQFIEEYLFWRKFNC